jgi:hypothetical protein
MGGESTHPPDPADFGARAVVRPRGVIGAGES